ncbi:MAG: hypothetical protein GTO17_04750 [Candidatus Aminicenantes bacterium]|nr:hypothetical protein [Candidatus Aminicenantes bacterium]
MAKRNWRDDTRDLFEDLSIIEISKKETLDNFDQFCEFIAEPAFENLADELKIYKIKAKFKRKKDSVHFMMNFYRSNIDDFHYIISLPKNSIELKLKLTIKGRPNKKSPLVEKELQFMNDVDSPEVLKLKLEDLIKDILDQYRKFKYEALSKLE